MSRSGLSQLLAQPPGRPKSRGYECYSYGGPPWHEQFRTCSNTQNSCFQFFFSIVIGICTILTSILTRVHFLYPALLRFSQLVGRMAENPLSQIISRMSAQSQCRKDLNQNCFVSALGSFSFRRFLQFCSTKSPQHGT